MWNLRNRTNEQRGKRERERERERERGKPRRNLTIENKPDGYHRGGVQENE